MAGDKGAEVPKSSQEYLHRPKAVKDAIDYYKKPQANAFRSAISRAVDSLRRRGRPSIETASPAGPIPRNETAQRFADRMNSGSTQEPSTDLDTSDHTKLRRELESRQPGLWTDFNLRVHHNLSKMGRKYFDGGTQLKSAADETTKPSEE